MSKYLLKYSAVVDGQGTPVGRPEDHERNVEAVLKTLAASKVGRAVFRKIVTHGVVRIRPYLASNYAKHGVCNALAFSAKHQEKVSSGLHRSAVDVHYSVNTWAATSGCSSGPGAAADEILLHELVHAMRALGGDRAHVPLTGKLSRYHNEEEFFAVLVSNIYISESGRQPPLGSVGPGNSGLRADHSGFNTLPDEQSLVVGFMMDDDNFRLVKKFCDQHTKIAPLMGEAQARFNPIRVYYRWKSLNIELRNGELARSK